MHVPTEYNPSYNQYRTSSRRLRAPPTVTDMPLDDDFDAATVARDSEVYRMWEDDSKSAVDPSEPEHVGLQNVFKNVYGSEARTRRNSESLVLNIRRERELMSGGRSRDNQSDRGGSGREKVHGALRGKAELVEERVLEDGPTRTISFWREQVAYSSTNSAANTDSDTRSRRLGRRRTPSGNLSANSESAISRDSRRKTIAQMPRNSLDRSVPRSPLQRSFRDAAQLSPLHNEKGQSSPMAPGSPRGLTASPTLPKNVSPSVRRASSGIGNYSGSISRIKSTSTLELLLSSCQPSLVHLTSALEDLGIRKEEHLRAIAKMTEETRDREVKEEAIKRGVTVIEWAIFLDKLQALYSCDDMYA